MPTYESTGSLTTIEKSYSTPQTPNLSGLVYTLNGETISVDVVGSPGEAGEEAVTQNLDGASSYDLTWSSAHTSFEVVFNLSTADTSTTPEVDDLTLTGGPNAPTNLQVSEVTDSPTVSLSWVDNASTETEYRVYRSTSPGTTTADYTLIDTLAADTTSYTDTTASLGTRYYYRVAAASDGGESLSNEVRAEPNTDEFTESISWDAEREWGYGSFSNTTTDGSGNLEVAVVDSRDFTYDITAPVDDGSGSQEFAGVSVVDVASSTTVASAQVLDGASDSGTLTVDTSQYNELEVTASVTDTNPDSGGDASITDEFNQTASVNTTTSFDGGNVQDSFTDFYQYPADGGSYTTETWDYTNTTTVSRLDASITLPSDESVTANIYTSDDVQQDSISLSAGSNSYVVATPADDHYYVVLQLDAGDGSDTPVVDSMTLEAHTPPTNLQITNTTETSNSLSWTGWGAVDNYELYRSESTPVTTSDTLIAEPTSGTTTYDDTGLAEGRTYYYNIRGEYTGE